MDAKELGSMRAFPWPGFVGDNANGLTKRELFAAMAMQGLLSRRVNTIGEDMRRSEMAVKAADALLRELAKEQQP